MSNPLLIITEFSCIRKEEESRKKYKSLCMSETSGTFSWSFRTLPREMFEKKKKRSFTRISSLSPLAGFDTVSVQAASSLTRYKSITQYVRRATHSALVLCPVCVSTVPFVLIPVPHRASALSCHSLTKSRNGGAKAGPIMADNALKSTSGCESRPLGPQLLTSKPPNLPDSPH